jgi:hypothetical protein
MCSREQNNKPQNSLGYLMILFNYYDDLLITVEDN